MGELLTFDTVYEKSKKVDPTLTTTLRNTFARKMRSKFSELALVVKRSVYDNDCFGLKKNVEVHQMNPAPLKAFSFGMSADKIDMFMNWLQQQVEAGIITITTAEQLGTAIQTSWMDRYILDSYKRGILRARKELAAAGLDVPKIEDTGGINAVLGMPMHLDRVGVLYTRVFNELKGITDAMDKLISTVLSQGMIDGDGPALLARKLVAVINGTGVGDLSLTDTLGRFIPAMRRAEMLARTEIIRAHHLATIQEYRNWGLLNIKVLGEWKTAGDDRVCTKCESLDGKIFTLDEIEGMIPYHPNCRCIALPYIEDVQKYVNK